jgi:hypothetical protein
MKDLIITIVAMTLLVTGGANAQSSEKFKGTAYDKKSGKFIYVESHRRVIKNGNLIEGSVEYLNKSGKSFVSKKIEYEFSSIAPNYRLEDKRTGYIEGVKILPGNRVSLYNQSSSGKKMQKAIKAFNPKMLVVDAGFDEFIRKNWNRLQNNERILIQFAVPSMLRVVEFRVYKVSSSKIKGKAASVFSMDLGNFFLRLFMDPIIVSYDNKEKKLLRYEGVSNIVDSEGDNHVAKILF